MQQLPAGPGRKKVLKTQKLLVEQMIGTMQLAVGDAAQVMEALKAIGFDDASFEAIAAAVAERTTASVASVVGARSRLSMPGGWLGRLADG